MNDRCFIDIHVLQTVPPSCVNRDDTGSPKTAVYGGVTRARVSSQAWKRAMRQEFQEHLSPELKSYRTQKLPKKLAEAIRKLDPGMDEEKAENAAENTLSKFKLKFDSKRELEAMFFINNTQIEKLAELTVHKEKDKKLYDKAINENPAIDQLLFGRMVASDPSLNYDAAAQVAHSISTHAVQNEFDYFTAVDDCAPGDNAGAGHIGTTEFNSATLYRYATVNVAQLNKEIQDNKVVTEKSGDIVENIKCFVKAFCTSMPTGKQNSFANRTLPDAVYITVRDDQPVNLVGAFEKPVRGGDEGYLAASEKALAEYAKETYDNEFVHKPVLSLATGYGDKLASVAEVMPFSKALDRLGEYVAAHMTAGGDQ